MRLSRWLGIVPVGLLVLTGTALGQNPGSVEVGYDLSFGVWMFDNGSQTSVSVGIPGGSAILLAPQEIRIGYLVSGNGETEFPIGVALISGNGTIWALGSGVYGVYNITGPDSETIPFLRGGGLINMLGDGRNASVQFGIGGTVGFRRMISDRLASRFGFGLQRFFETEEIGGHTDILLEIGVSFFTPGRPES